MLPLLIFMLFHTTTYADAFDEAFSKAKEAALIQTGAKENLEKLYSYGYTQIESLGVNVKLLGAGAYIYRVCRDKQMNIRLDASHKLLIKQDNISLQISF